jgi:xylose isomerase
MTKALLFSVVLLVAFLQSCSCERIADITCGVDGNRATDLQDWRGEYFPNISYIKYEGPASHNPLAYKYYNAEEVILGKKMKDWLRFSVAFWHTFRGDGGDPFGSATKLWPWDDGSNSLNVAARRMRANFEFLKKLGVEKWCFHDRDIAPEGSTLEESNVNLDYIASIAEELQEGTNIRPLWGTAQLFKHPRYMHGAATSPDVGVYAYAAAQVKKAIEVTKRLGGENYVFWGGREGYQTLLNTDLKKELDHMATFLRSAAAYKKKIGFKGTLLLEPKPQEPTKHQYDWDAATTMGFLKNYELSEEYKLNLECNHATLSGHSCHHELEVARINGMLGSVDANTGDAQTGWDTDQFLTDVSEATLVMLSVIKNGGLAPGGFNFDAKLRRESVDVEDLFIAHISGMDTIARGLRNAAKLLEEGRLTKLVEDRYASFNSPLGKLVEEGKVGFEELEKVALESGEPPIVSGKQELAEMIFYSYV